MRIFRDVVGRTWRIEFDAATIARVKEYTGVDLRALNQSKLPFDIKDRSMVGRLLWCAVEPQATREGVSPEQLIAGLVDRRKANPCRALSTAVTALLHEMTQLVPKRFRARILKTLE